MAVKKRAYRQVRRDPNTSILSVVFIDADTGQVVTNLDGYEIIDQGAPNPTTPPTTPTTPDTGTPSNNDQNKSDPFDWEAFQSRPGASKGTNMLGDLQKVFGGGVLGLPGIKEAVDTGKRSLAQWIAQTTGVDTLAADELNKEPAKSSGPNGVDEGNMNNVPPVDYVRPTYDPNSPGSQQLDEIMGTPRAATDPKTDAPVGEVARNVSYDPKNIGIREYPVDNTVTTDFAAAINATDPTVRAVINSGGQEPLYVIDDSGKKVRNPDADPGVNRIGTKTVNHDITVNGDSYAFDSLFYRGDKQITPASDPEFFQQLAKNAVVAGFTQIGMEGNVVHLGKDYRDTEVRTWGYPGGLPEAIAQGVKAGIQLKKADEANGNKLYTSMVAAVAGNDPQAPRPNVKGASSLTNTMSALTGSKLDNPEFLQKLKDVEKAVGVPLDWNNNIGIKLASGITGGVSAAEKALSGLGNVIADLTPDSLAVPPELIDAANKIPAMAFADKATGFGADIINAPGNAMRDAIVGQIQPEIGSRIGEAVRGASGGLQEIAASGATLNEQIGKGFMQLITDLVKPKEQAPAVGTQTAKTFALNTGAKAVDKGGSDEQLSAALAAPYSLSDKERARAIVQTVWGEAEDQGIEGKLAVLNVIKNRALSGDYPLDPMDVVKEPEQFDGIKRIPRSSAEIASFEKQYPEILKLAELVFAGQVPDNTGGSVYFHAADSKPGWADKVVNPKYGPLQIGDHTFYPSKEIAPGIGKKIVTAEQSSGGPISKGFMTPTVPLSDSQTTLGTASVSTGATKGSRSLGSLPAGPVSGTYRDTVAEPNSNNAGSSYNSDVVSSTKKTSAPAEEWKSTAIEGSSSVASSGSKSTGAAASGFMSKSVSTVPKTTSSQEPSPITKSIVSGGAKSTGTAATKTSTSTTTAKPMNKGML